MTSGQPTEFPPSSITLGDDLLSNTEYNVSVMTTVNIKEDQRTVNSDFTKPQSGCTGYTGIFYYC